MKDKKIIFLLSQPLDKRNYNRFDIDEWISLGWEIELWDLTSLMFPKVWENFLIEGNEIFYFSGYRRISTKEDIQRLLKTAKNTFVIIDFAECQNRQYLYLRRTLIKMGSKWIFFRLGSIPLPKEGTKADNGKPSRVLSLVQQFVKLVRKISFEQISFQLDKRFVNKFKKNWYIVVSGNDSFQFAKTIVNQSNIIMAHSFDFDIYRKEKLKIDISESDYIVFLDEYMPYHPDFLYQNIHSPVTPDAYYNAITKSLSEIATILNCNVKIAAHPRASYTGLKEKSYGDYKIYENQTNDLIKKAKAVVCHASASIQLAVLYNKPLLFLTTDQLLQSPYQNFISVFAETLGKSIINASNPINVDKLENFMDIDKIKYENYIRSYIKMPYTSDGSIMQIVERAISKELHNAK